MAAAPHLLLLPSLRIGHLIPFTELAKRLASRGFLISFFVSSNHGLSITRNKIGSPANISIVELHLSHGINPQASDSKRYASDQIQLLLLLNHTLLQDAFQKVYVSFGSQSLVSSSQTTELELGLEASWKPFLWVLKLPASDDNNPSLTTLDGFRRRTEQQGRIVSGWTDQLAILSHPSVGAFITHCGWNSVLEAISMGIPLICWPLLAQQHFNARFVVDEAKVGIEVVKRQEDQTVTRDEIKRSVRTLMDNHHNGDERVKSLKENCNSIKELARKAVSEYGSSSKNFDMFVQDILSLQNENKNQVSNSM